MDTDTQKPVVHPLLLRLARGCVERMDNLNLSGKKRDDAALNYFCGAGKVLDILGDEANRNIVLGVIWVLSVRGYSEVLTLARLGEVKAGAV